MFKLRTRSGSGRSRTMRAGATATVLAIVLATFAAMPAAASANSAAAAWPNDTYNITDSFEAGVAIGGIIWGNRTSTIQGSVEDFGGSASTTVYFTAYAGSTNIDGDSRTAGPGVTLPYNFGIGNPNLVGGFDRLKIQVCQPQALLETCSDPVMLHRNEVAEVGFWRP